MDLDYMNKSELALGLQAVVDHWVVAITSASGALYFRLDKRLKIFKIQREVTINDNCVDNPII